MKAVICPVCEGAGKRGESKCWGCDGRGWVEVGEGLPLPYHQISYNYRYYVDKVIHSPPDDTRRSSMNAGCYNGFY